jgi:hypothetical protein
MEATVEDAVWRNQDWDDKKKGQTYVIFRDDSKLNKFKTEELGRPVYEPIVVLEIILTGDQMLRPIREMRDEDKEKYPIEWARYQQKSQSKLPGTPLEAVNWLSHSQVREYKAMNVFTVEQIAELPDITAKRFAGHSTVRDMAVAFLGASKEGAAVREAEALKSQVAELKAQMAQLLASQPANPQQQAAAGRPKKADPANI